MQLAEILALHVVQPLLEYLQHIAEMYNTCIKPCRTQLACCMHGCQCAEALRTACLHYATMPWQL